MTNQDTIAGFAELFAGRTDAYGLSYPDDWGNKKVKAWRVPEGLSRDHQHFIERHLNGEMDLGVYPMRYKALGFESDWEVKWVCVDLDIAAPGKTRYDFDTTEEAMRSAIALMFTASDHNVTLWPEITTNGGVHVWGFLSDWTVAETARNAMLWLCQQSGTPTGEVNPKQVSLPSAEQLGNFVRLPYFGGLTNSVARPIVNLDFETWFSPEVWVEDAIQELISPVAMTALASKYVPPMAPSPMPYVGEGVEVTPDWLKNLPPILKYILKDGTGKQSDRSIWLYSLAHKCQDSGLSPEDALTYLQVADDLWTGKFTNRPDAEQRYSDMVGKAYSNA